MNQEILLADKNYKQLGDYFLSHNIRRIFLVCSGSFKLLHVKNFFDQLSLNDNIQIIYFNDIQPNPIYESVIKGINAFNNSNCDMIVAVGGGSALDVAKSIKLFSNMDTSQNLFKQQVIENPTPLLAIPTTAGSGSEATQFAVIYYNGEKQSISHTSIIPNVILFDPSTLESLPEYQKKSTVLDALCHAIESYWSINSTSLSKDYSQKAIKLIFENIDGYLNKNENASKMFEAAYYAGKAINITQTTAGHAMCYKLTSIYKISHGHAASLCVEKLWSHMLKNTDKCSDSRGIEYLKEMFYHLALIMGTESEIDALLKFSDFLKKLNLNRPTESDENIYRLLTSAVNPVRLKNNPIKLTETDINSLYHEILGE